MERSRFRSLVPANLKLLICLSFGVLISIGTIGAQEPQTTSASEQQAAVAEISGASTTYRLRPEEVSNFSIVQSLYLEAHHRARAPHGRQLTAVLLEKLEIPKEGEAAELFASNIEEGVAIVLTRSFDPSLEGEAFDRNQFEAIQAKADRFGAHFRALLDGLAELGVDISGILAYCENEIRPRISVTTTDPTGDSDFWVAVSTFDLHLVGLEEAQP